MRLKSLRGKHDKSDDPGQISHYKALSVALAATIGMGNIAGVAVAISLGGPGAIFWMWISALLGMATKYFTCTLAVMYRGHDANGDLQGGPMYVIREGVGAQMASPGMVVLHRRDVWLFADVQHQSTDPSGARYFAATCWHCREFQI